MKEIEPPRLSDESAWYVEHAALLFSTLKWSLLGAASGLCVGLGTRFFLWTLALASDWAGRLEAGWFHYYFLLPLAMTACVWLIRTFAPSAKGHGTEAVIAAVHENHGKVDPMVAPVKLLATVLTIACGGSVGKEGAAAQIGAAITSWFSDLFGLKPEDRRRLVICGISGGFAAVFGTPISGALFGIEVLYLGRLEYGVLFPSFMAGIVAHLVCGARAPMPAASVGLGDLSQPSLILLAVLFGALFGLAALALIESMRALERALRRFEKHPYWVAAGGGLGLILLFLVAGDSYAGLGLPTIEAALAGTARLTPLAFALKIAATAITLEAGGSGGIVTPLFFIGSAAGAAFARAFGLPEAAFAVFGFVSVVAAAANTPVAACVMGLELLPPGPLGVYAGLCACTAFLFVGHRSVYASQKLAMSKSAALEMEFGRPLSELVLGRLRLKEGSITQKILRRLHRLVR